MTRHFGQPGPWRPTALTPRSFRDISDDYAAREADEAARRWIGRLAAIAGFIVVGLLPVAVAIVVMHWTGGTLP